MSILPRPAMFGGNPLAYSLSALFGGLSAAGQPGGFSNFGLGSTQGVQNLQNQQYQQQLMDLRQREIQRQEEADRTANQDRLRREQLSKQLAGMFQGGQTPVQQIGDVPGRQVGGVQQPGLAAEMGLSPQLAGLFSTYAEMDPEGFAGTMMQRAFAEPKDDRTSGLKEYEAAVAQGFQGTFFDYKKALQQAGASSNPVTIFNKDYGTIPPGFRLVETPQGVQMEAIPGSPAEADIAATGEKKAATQAKQEQMSDIVTADIKRALDIVGKSPTSTTGFFGQVLSGVGGTAANDVRALVQTIRSNVGFDQLQQMRNSSPTGGALGPVSDAENALLQSVMGNLEQSQTQEQFEYNLQRLHDTILDIVHGPGNGGDRLLGRDSSDLKSKYGLE